MNYLLNSGKIILFKGENHHIAFQFDNTKKKQFWAS